MHVPVTRFLSIHAAVYNVFNVKLPSDLPPNPALISRSGYADVASGDGRSVNRCGHAHLACNFPINVTVPSAGVTGIGRCAER